MKWKTLVFAAALALPACGSGGTPKAGPSFSYEGYASALKAHVDGRGRVDYAALARDRKGLDSFLEGVAGLSPKVFSRWKEKDRLAFWINVYNALTIRAVLDHLPIKSIRGIPGVWKKLKWRVMGKDLTLDFIENGILRKRFREPRIHMGLVCASRGCPFLLNEPFRGERLEAQLDGRARLFFADPKKFRIDEKAGKVYVSPLFDWYKADFLKAYAPKGGFKGLSPEWKAVMNFASRYVKPPDRACLVAGGYQIVFLPYDWSLNKAPERKNPEKKDR